MPRRLPVYLLIDTSGSMKGEPIESVNVGIESMLASLRTDPYALDTVSLSIITYDAAVKQVLPLTPLEDIQMPHITTPDSGPTHMGMALELLYDCVQREVSRGQNGQKGDWRPILFIMTDGKPSDLMTFNQMVPKIKSLNFSSIVACAAGPKARTDDLKKLTDNVCRIDALDGHSFMSFFHWVSDLIGEGGQSGHVSADADGNSTLMPPPPEIILF